MKKLYYLLAIIAVMFASCDPLSQTYKTLDALPQKPGSTLVISLTTTYKSASDANASTNIPATLASRYPNATNSTAASVTFLLSSSSSNVNVPDSTYSRVTSTLSSTDYVFPAGTLPNGVSIAANSNPYLTSTSVIDYLNYKYPTPVANQLIVLTYNYYDAGGSPAGGAVVTDSFLYIGGSWTKVYTVSAAQYASVNRGTNNYFVAADYNNLASYFNSFLLTDPNIITPKVGDVKYVSYRFYQSSTIFQKIMTFTFDGSNWLHKQTLPYLKLSGTWVPDPTIYITIPYTSTSATYYTQADYQYLNTLTNIGNTTNRDNVAKYGDFNIQPSSQYYWPDADLTAALAAILLKRYPNAVIGVPYKVTYYVYNGSTIAASKTFAFDGTSFVLQ